MKPRLEPPLAADCWFTSARKPAHRGEAGPAVISRAGTLVAEKVVGIPLRRYVRHIAHARGSLIRGIGHAGLPTRNREAIVGRTAAAVGPCGFRLPGTARAIRGQIRSAHSDHVNGLRRIAVVSWVRPRIRPRVPGSYEQSLALRREFLKYGIKLRSVVRIPSP